jgi:hypothetical protein
MGGVWLDSTEAVSPDVHEDSKETKVKNNETTSAALMKSCSVMGETVTRTHTVSSRLSVLKWFYSIAYKFYMEMLWIFTMVNSAFLHFACEDSTPNSSLQHDIKIAWL